MENPIRIDDLGVPLFLETPKWNWNPWTTFFLPRFGFCWYTEIHVGEMVMWTSQPEKDAQVQVFGVVSFPQKSDGRKFITGEPVSLSETNLTPVLKTHIHQKPIH